MNLYRGGCEKCGYSKNYAALELHHLNSETKSFQLDLRSLSNRKWLAITEEAKKCILLCSCAMQSSQSWLSDGVSSSQGNLREVPTFVGAYAALLCDDANF